MSIDNLGGKSSYTDPIKRAVVDYNIPVVVAAGNDGWLAELYAPGNSPDAITVGATDQLDLMYEHSNYGEVVNILAPGEDIMSAITTGDSSTGKKSGTSMAAPLVSGAIAILLEEDINLSAKNDVTDANTVIYKLIGLSTKDKISPTGPAANTPDRLLYGM